MIVKVKLLGGTLPRYNHLDEDAAFDIYAPYNFTVLPHHVTTVKVGIAVEIPQGYFGLVLGRSLLAKQGIAVLGGVMDSGYRGEWHMNFLNGGHLVWDVEEGDRIAQCVVLPVPPCNIMEVQELSPSLRGEKGLGSSGR